MPMPWSSMPMAAKGIPPCRRIDLEHAAALIAKGVGFGAMHYGVEIVPDQAGKEFQEWLGGHYENSFSCNPLWDAEYESFSAHRSDQWRAALHDQ